MTASFGFKRLGWAILAVVAFGVGALAITSFLIPADTVRQSVMAEIRSVTGLDPVLGGDVSVSLFPSGTITFTDVTLGDPKTGAPALTADRVVARLGFFSLLAGRFEISDVSLVRPHINVILDANGRSNWSQHLETLARALRPDPGRVASFSEIRIGDGTIVVRDANNHFRETLTQVELALAWPSISRSFGATGHFSWRGEPIEAAVSLGDFLAALEGERFGVKVRLSGAPLKFAYDGYLSARPTLRMEGTVAADAASLRTALRWAGQPEPPGGGLGRFSLKAQANVVGGALSLSNAVIELDGNVSEGALTYATDGRQLLQGTLAAESLDLTPYVSAVRLLAASERDWSRLPIRLEGLKGTDIDLRLSAANVTIASAKLGRTAIGGNLRNGQLTVTVGEAQAFGGMVQGSFALADSQAGADLKAQLQFTGVDFEQCLGDLFGIRRLEGKGNLGFAVEASGANVYGLARSLNGTATLAGKGGSIAGVNVEQLLRRLERRPLSGGGDFRSGRTPYDTLAVTMKIADGTATIDEVRIESPAVRLALAGTASIPERDLDLKGMASLLASVGGNAPGFDLPFVVQGPWDAPLMLPDPEILIRRSGAAAPLLNAVRNRNPRDTVRSAIERLTGASASAPEAPASVTTPLPLADPARTPSR